MDIKDCGRLISGSLKNGKKFVRCKTKNLVSTGENYGSTLLSVEITTSSGHGQEETLNCVAKLTPPTEMLWGFFNTKLTFKKEIAMYDTIVPTLNEFGREKGIDNLMPFFAKCYGARYSLDPNSEEIDHDAALLLENLVLSQFELGDRFKGFDQETAELILNDLAVFHAAPIAYKLEKPNEFKDKIKPHLKKGFHYIPSEELWETLKPAAEKHAKCGQLTNSFGKHWKRYEAFVKEILETREPFATITHNDYWTNNTMIKYQDGKPVKNVMLDFQMYEYGSPAHDLLFFLYSSVEIEVLEQHLDDLIEVYYQKFIETLKKLQCDITPFNRPAFMEEISWSARMVQFTHLLYMLFPINTLKEEAKDLTNVNGESDIFQKGEKYNENFYKRLHFTLLDFDRRGWID